MYLFIYLFICLFIYYFIRVSKNHRATLGTSALILGTKKTVFKKISVKHVEKF